MTTRRFPPRPVSETAAPAAVFAAVAVLPVALSFNPYYLSIFIAALILGAVSMAWNLLAGVCGQVSFGHAAFFGIGAYTAGLLYAKLGLSAWWGLAATVPVVRALFRIAKALPDFAWNTRRLPADAIAVREALYNAKSPERFLFVELPEALICG